MAKDTVEVLAENASISIAVQARQAQVLLLEYRKPLQNPAAEQRAAKIAREKRDLVMLRKTFPGLQAEKREMADGRTLMAWLNPDREPLYFSYHTKDGTFDGDAHHDAQADILRAELNRENDRLRRKIKPLEYEPYNVFKTPLRTSVPHDMPDRADGRPRDLIGAQFDKKASSFTL